MISGFINLDKPPKISSGKALGILKRILRQNGIECKIGHFGTLDPLAVGVLPIALGRATRLFGYALDKEKIYEAEFIFGASSPSLDTDTEISYSDGINVTADELRRVIPSQIGEIMQTPPVFSAKNVNGVRAYKLARKGEDTELAPNKVVINSIEILAETAVNTFGMRIVCGGGTYIRAIGRDIASSLGTTAVMSALTRVKSGIFEIGDSVTLDFLEKNPDKITEKIVPLRKMLDLYESVAVNSEELKFLRDGKRITSIRADAGKYYSVYSDGEPVGIGASDDEGKFFVKTWLL
jgi:tRNA pseudouridine55 synthase